MKWCLLLMAVLGVVFGVVLGVELQEQEKVYTQGEPPVVECLSSANSNLECNSISRAPKGPLNVA